MMKVKMKIITAVLISAFLNACGGGLSVAGTDGITGTGITAGRVTGFGSIWVNGIKFNVESATFSRDGVVSAGQDEFEIGEYVVIKGNVDSTGTLGEATEVIFEDLLDGAVTLTAETLAGTGTDNTIEVLGQLVEIDSNTNLIDDRGSNASSNPFNNLTDLHIGYIVEVSGVKDSTGLIKATSIKLKEEKGLSNELKGTISELKILDKTFMIEGILVDYSGASFDGFTEQDLQDGQFVEAESTTEIIAGPPLTLIASEIELEDEHLIVDLGTELEMEGIVTRFVTILDFDVNGIPVTTNSETVYENGTENEVGLNTSLEVEGQINSSGILVAEEIEFED